MHWLRPVSLCEHREGIWVKGCIMKLCSLLERPGPRKWSLVPESLIPLIASDLVEFTDEEGYGRYLDLHDCYLQYINLKASEKLDYITYLSIFDQLFDIPKERKNAEYKR